MHLRAQQPVLILEQHAHHLDPLDADNSLQPASKRVRHSSTATDSQQHANPIDDVIHLKRIGTYLFCI